ncbi:MAG: zinc ribbon domain-containing protein [Methanobacteriota archaeon]|nr:MAG: zinc ribbon domain-containing protein [Euryarchaeota archaeon]
MYVREATLPFGLALAGGILILIFGVIYAMFFELIGGPIFLLLVFSILGVIGGSIIIIGAIFAHGAYRSRTAWGIVIVVMATLSFLAGGGLIVGAILGILGGIFFIAWKYVSPSPSEVAECPYCGTHVLIGHFYCYDCGSRLYTPNMMREPPYSHYRPAKKRPSSSRDIKMAPTTCRKCGSELPKGGGFCPKCGASEIRIKK